MRITDLIKIHEHSNERCLTIGSHKSNDLVLNGLHTLLNLILNSHFCDLCDCSFFVGRERLHFLTTGDPIAKPELLLNLLSDLLATHINKWSKVRQRNGLSAVLIGCYLSNDLGGDVAGSREAVWLLNQSAGDNSAVLEHIFQVDQTAVVHMLHKIVAIMEVDDTFLMCFRNFLREQQMVSDITTDLAGNVISLSRQNDRILVGVLLNHRFICTISDGEDLLVQRGGITQKLMLIAIFDVRFGNNVLALPHQLGFYIILDLLNRDSAVPLFITVIQTGRNLFGDFIFVSYGAELFNFLKCLYDGICNLAFIEAGLLPVTLNCNHTHLSFAYCSTRASTSSQVSARRIPYFSTSRPRLCGRLNRILW